MLIGAPNCWSLHAFEHACIASRQQAGKCVPLANKPASVCACVRLQAQEEGGLAPQHCHTLVVGDFNSGARDSVCQFLLRCGWGGGRGG